MEMKIEGMHCSSCITLVKEALEEGGATNVKVSMGKAVFDRMDIGKAKELVEAEGYKVK